MRTPGLLRRLRRGERGSIAVMVPPLAVAFLALGGLVVDGARDLNARGEAQAYAEEAARAGATAVDFRSPTLLLRQGKARQEVADYCRAAKRANDAVLTCGVVKPDTFTYAPTSPGCPDPEAPIVVNVRVTMRLNTTLLGITGVRHLDAGGQAKARPFQGVDADHVC